MSATESTVVDCQNLDEAIDKYTTRLGYRLDMIMTADAPREALLSKKSEPPAVAGGLTHDVTEQEQTRRTHFVRLICENAGLQPSATAGGSDWVTGRAGMEYRDLIPGRLGGKVIASHIRLTKGGEVPDYVHYHKVDFQMIYCKRGRIKVVYEDQGPPFWLETGDCVLQPPEIRHRVLECTEGAEVIEVSMPAEHETWVEHEIFLPNDSVNPKREFSGRRFYRFQESNSEPFVGGGYVRHEIDFGVIVKQRVSVSVNGFVDRDNNSMTRGWFAGSSMLDLVYVLTGALDVVDSKGLPNSFEPGHRFRKDDCFIVAPNTAFTFDWSQDLKLLSVRIAI